METAIRIRPLHLIERMTDELGVAITFAYDDLVFIEHGAVMLQFDDEREEAVNLFISSDVHHEDLPMIRDDWQQVALMHGVHLTYRGRFMVQQTFGKEEIAVTLL